ncbi:MAG: signal recognition particle-docking protein FtsY, partial [Deltaproteobacteria bacterium]|nr:signal recognition particle-docking protein FtsY [Deltaproteobacteria bacterium]
EEGADPAAVAWEGMDKALAGGHDIVFVDTAGRLHTKTNLIEELKKVRAVIARKHPGAPQRSVLIMDATTGQNALTQAKIFKESCGIDELILTKLDGTAKGGMALAVVLRLGIPITYVGLGEKMEDLRPFNGEDFARALMGAAV